MQTFQEYVIPWVFGLCICKDKVLLQYRTTPPNQHEWNGVGGKMKENENKDDALIREVLEETGIDIRKEDKKFVGLVTWDIVNKPKRGMYAYIIYVKQIPWKQKETREGMLEWKDTTWVLNKSNHEVVENIPYFLPEMLERRKPMHYHFVHPNPQDDREITEFTVKELQS